VTVPGGPEVVIPVGGIGQRLDNDSPDYTFSPGLLLAVALAYDSLAGPEVTVDADGVLSPDFRRMRPRLAVGWREEDNGDWVIDLRPGLVSQAGNEWTAEAVAWGFEKAIAQGVMASWRLAGVVGVQRVEVTSRHQVRFCLRAPYETFPNWLLSGPPYTVDSTEVRRHATAADPWGLEWLDGHVAGWGPYALTGVDSDHMLFDARPEYWAGLPAAARLDVRALPDRRTALNMIKESRPVVLLGTDPDETVALMRDQDLTVLRTWAGHASVEIDFTSPPFDDIRVRQALALATPYERIRADGLLGMARPWNGPVKGVSQWYPDSPIPYTHQPARARRLLAKAGHGEGLTSDFYVEPHPASQRIAAIIAQAWREAGVDLVFRDITDAPQGWLPPLSLRMECGHNLSEPVYDIAHDYAAMNPLLPLPGGPPHVGNWRPRWNKNPAILAQLADLLTTTDRSARRQKFDQLQRDIVEFGSSIYLAEMQQVTIANQHVPGSLLAPGARLFQATSYQNPRADNYLPPRPPWHSLGCDTQS
jgi:ABC-type transport system substrate-binding protein